MRGLLSLMLAIPLAVGCGDDGGDDKPSDAESFEGSEPGDCTDLADNDMDGRFDCDDDGCAGSPECEESDEDGGTDDGGTDDGGTDDGGTEGIGTEDNGNDTGSEHEVEGDDIGECTDGLDNDSDGLIDCDDTGCDDAAECETTGPLGSEDNPGESCQQILEMEPSYASQSYWLAGEDSSAFRVYCDMERNGGGWALFAHHTDTSLRTVQADVTPESGPGVLGDELWVVLRNTATTGLMTVDEHGDTSTLSLAKWRAGRCISLDDVASLINAPGIMTEYHGVWHDAADCSDDGSYVAINDWGANKAYLIQTAESFDTWAYYPDVGSYTYHDELYYFIR